MQSTETKSSRAWLSPLTGISFVVISITGILMFFHLRFPGMTVLHELGGILFVIVAALHLKLNWHILLSYCRQRRGRIALGIGAVVMGIFLVLGLGHDKEHRQHSDSPHSHAETNRH